MSRTYTGTQIIYRAARALGNLRSGQPVPTEQLPDFMDSLNDMVDGWQVDQRKIFCIAANLYQLTAGQQFYLIGPNAPASTVANGNTYIGIQAPRPNAIEEANILIQSTNPVVRYQMAIVNAEQWSTIAVQTLPFAIPMVLWNDNNFPSTGATAGCAALSLWPGPLGSYPLELFTWQQLQQFADATTSYAFPPGYAEAIIFSLAEQAASLFRIYFKVPNAVFAEQFSLVQQQARRARQNIDESNARQEFMAIDPAFQSVDSRYGAWNYLTGGWGRTL